MSAAHSADERRRKLLIRSLLVGGTTIATIISAQSLTWIDAARFAPIPEETGTPAPLEEAIIPATTITATTINLLEATPTRTIKHQAPNLVVLRRPSTPQPLPQTQSASPAVSVPGVSSGPAVSVIQPPMPVIAQPQPIVVSQPPSNIVSAPAPVVVRSGSSR